MSKALERREKQRESLIEAAEAVISAKGIAGLKSRELAAKIGVANGAVFNLVEDMDEIVPSRIYVGRPVVEPPKVKEVQLLRPNEYAALAGIAQGMVDDTRGTANWVAWRTTRDDLGPSIPRPDFRPDPRLPAGFRRIGSYDYSGSGFDRGHLVPSADRFANPQLNEETFMMTNIVPKTAALNQGPWEKLERHARALARRLGAVQQIAGCYGEKERLKGKVTVPTNCWKIIVALPSGRSIADRDRRMQVIAVDMPNIDGIDDVRWETYKTSVEALQQRTGLGLSAIPR